MVHNEYNPNYRQNTNGDGGGSADKSASLADLDLHDAARELGGNVTDHGKAIECPSPGHKSPADRTLFIRLNETDRHGFYAYSRCGDDWRIGRAHVIKTLGLTGADRPPLTEAEKAERATRLAARAEEEAAERTANLAQWSVYWDSMAMATEGGFAALYLKGRGLALPPGVFRERNGEMRARIVDPVTGELRGFHRTFFGGNPVVRHFRNTEVTNNGVIRLIEGDRTLMVGEGIENALSLPLVLGRQGATVWATGNCHNLEGLPPLAEFDELIIAVDIEKSGAGRRDSNACAAKWLAAGKRVQLVVPILPEGEEKFDLNNIWQVEGGPVEGEHYKIETPRGCVRRRAPARDAPKTPVMELLDTVLLTDELEPPMRDLDGHPVEIIIKEPMGLHALTADAANDDEDAETSRLPPPPMQMIVRHDIHSLALEIEKYVEFYAGERTVALHDNFLKPYLAYRTSKLPKVGALMTLPVVLPDGTLLAENGLNRKLKTLFRIEPAILKLLPRGKVGDDDVMAAMRFLLDEWMCDVQAEGEGKYTLIALALSTLERLLLPERPAFFVTAGKRGGGKTTALTMLSVAITGEVAAATAWSPDAEERRKALLPLLRQNCPMIVWDNIKLGTMISCPSIEKALTGTYYEDRVLGVSGVERVPATTILCFTGNNIGPKGDMASRSLVVRITVDRPDPENRAFKHIDPVGWTLAHRGQILAALYTVLLGNRRKCEQPQGRFKLWQRLVGSAVEHAATLLGSPVDFSKMFLAVEDEDEESLANVDVLLALVAGAGGLDMCFHSADVLEYLKKECAEARVLKAFMDQKGDGYPSTRSITAKLKTIVDGPVQIGNEVWVLRSARTPTDMIEFQVVNLKNGGKLSPF